jgi:hypothetical protein
MYIALPSFVKLFKIYISKYCLCYHRHYHCSVERVQRVLTMESQPEALDALLDTLMLSLPLLTSLLPQASSTLASIKYTSFSY